VNNGERASRLLMAGRELEGETRRALERGSWNLTVRRAQEVVELTLKGLLALVGVEYPKSHDVGAVFVQHARIVFPDLAEDVAGEIVRVSAELARKRAPAFYFEEEHDEVDARTAMGQASRIVAIGQGLEDSFRKPRDEGTPDL
jgi:HEPN domain-containing protein